MRTTDELAVAIRRRADRSNDERARALLHRLADEVATIIYFQGGSVLPR